MKALLEHDGEGCRQCRRRYEETTEDAVPPCDEEDGVLADGLCMFGYPALLAENVDAIDVWSDIQGLGGDVALALHDLELSDYDRGELLVNLRVIADEVEQYKKRKRAEQEAKRRK